MDLHSYVNIIIIIISYGFTFLCKYYNYKLWIYIHK